MPTPDSPASALGTEAIRQCFEIVAALRGPDGHPYQCRYAAEDELTALKEAAERWQFFRRFLSVEQDVSSGVEFLFAHDDKAQEVEVPLTGETTVDQLVDVAVTAARRSQPEDAA